MECIFHVQCEIIDTSSRNLTGRGNRNNYQLWLMIESADNFEQWVDAIVMFYRFPGNVKRKIDILMKMLFLAAIRKTQIKTAERF